MAKINLLPWCAERSERRAPALMIAVGLALRGLD